MHQTASTVMSEMDYYILWIKLDIIFLTSFSLCLILDLTGNFHEITRVDISRQPNLITDIGYSRSR